MRTITIRQLDQNLFKEINDLPVLVTRYGFPFCVISFPEGGEVATGPSNKVVVTSTQGENEFYAEGAELTDKERDEILLDDEHERIKQEAEKIATGEASLERPTSLAEARQRLEELAAKAVNKDQLQPCWKCRKPIAPPISQVFLDDDDARVTGFLCDTHLYQAKREDKYIGREDLL